MPHDMVGKQVRVGDVVVMTLRVSSIFSNAKACDVALQALDPQQTGEYLPSVFCSARLVTVVEPGASDDPA